VVFMVGGGCGMDEVGEKERVLWMDRERANRHC
jgi:hypothetical protein